MTWQEPPLDPEPPETPAARADCDECGDVAPLDLALWAGDMICPDCLRGRRYAQQAADEAARAAMESADRLRKPAGREARPAARRLA